MMSDDWVITPPFTPQTSTSENGVEGDDLDPGNGVSFTGLLNASLLQLI